VGKRFQGGKKKTKREWVGLHSHQTRGGVPRKDGYTGRVYREGSSVAGLSGEVEKNEKLLILGELCRGVGKSKEEPSRRVLLQTSEKTHKRG